MNYRTPLGRVKGLGSAHSGSKEWLLQKVSSVILAVLFVWFAFSMAFLLKSDIRDVIIWISKPLHTTLLLTFISVSIFHAAHGIQTIIEDYVHQTTKRVFYIYLVKTLLTLVWLVLVIAVLKVALNIFI
ncbi:succinate dehydrogenase, hydrophobic membrane anchor protein [Wohlfahrtiimonas chitiniclastica]|uniref:Succinate dehydrogenase hydrophobic membrane anchor subunit n=2 Tax=Wohlfahrtiimonas chitiniclastica TaxID=400946 RepID=L8XVY7_9GAMM|nr:succinate dehydrogenase, hydrophobic membrane anchor protein [Wohlfahrtiimonas chitiniclastica]ELV08057.1 Succinate dehydrogenase hydrophobic membrane anchor subunit [Wohlfahrtiimonas chitiniclastica SH04]KZS23761.1 succinate dehydrogenase hydrophobic membrane anchor subunit [Wohlfahrtiimonas chitiniclastica]KZX36538.1 succinate dehydrogenase [Wohlfahrtiimonas chitiniclastica]MBS7814435.1 succinate dehydrogenase, hydrophobic membrane anchor protein [Wohlfahrtiimonas chitiniclastica]MBS78164